MGIECFHVTLEQRKGLHFVGDIALIKNIPPGRKFQNFLQVHERALPSSLWREATFLLSLYILLKYGKLR